MKSFFAFIAGFFRQGAAESSSRLVGIACMGAFILLSAVVICSMLTAAWLGEAHRALYDPPVTMAAQIGTTLTMLMSTSLGALGLRKSPDITTNTTTVETPLATATVTTEPK